MEGRAISPDNRYALFGYRELQVWRLNPFERIWRQRPLIGCQQASFTTSSEGVLVHGTQSEAVLLDVGTGDV
jgi:hypothetical protein